MPGERLDADWVRAWGEATGAALAKLSQSFLTTHSFPPGENTVSPATDESHQALAALVDLTPIPSDLTTLYEAISEASLSDVGNGYFIHSPAMVAGHFREYGSPAIEGEWIAPVFASDGGGNLFAIGGDGRVLRSTQASWLAEFDVVAASLREFLDQLRCRITDQL